MNILDQPHEYIRELRTANDKLRGSLSILGDQYKALEREHAEMKKALEFIAENGGTTHETECGTITCTGSWCSEQARSALLLLPNVMMSHAVAWRGGCAAASVTSNRIGSIYLLGSFYIL
jgi:hypothetical protein